MKKYITPSGTLYNLYSEGLNAPHCMVAGSTGSGKSTVFEALLYSLCLSAPCDKSFAIIDLKQISLLKWEFMPHCMRYARNTSDALELVAQFVATMEQRYSEMLTKRTDKYEGTHFYLVIDEAADLLDTCPEVIEDLKRIGRLGRACNIHLIYATQSPDKKTIPAQLQQNIPYRLGLRCTDAVASRQIINQKGCESLPKYGEGILISPARAEVIKVKVPMVEESEINRIIEWWHDPSHIEIV